MQNIAELKSVIQNAADEEGFPVSFIPIKNDPDLYLNWRALMWSELEREQVVDYDKLVRKLECADYPRLIDTIESMLQELINNPKVNVPMADKELELLESYRRKSLDDFKKRDHHLTVLVFRKLAQIIIAKHSQQQLC